MRIRSGSSVTGAKTIGQKLFLSVFFGIFAAVGTGLLFVMGGAAAGTIATHFWTATPCTIVSSALHEFEGPERPAGWQVRYRYVVAGQEFTSSTLSRGLSRRDTSDDRRLSQRYAPGTETTCYVNSGQPDEAVLFRRNLASALLVFFPLPFVAIGFGGLYFVWRKPRVATEGASFTPPVTRAAAGASAKAAWFAVIFFGGFLVLGALGTWLLGVRPALRMLAARDWLAVPCTVLSSRVATHDGDDGDTYSVEVIYRYEIGGRVYTSDRFKFVGGSSSGRAGKAAIVARYAAGSTTVCYVNPEDPTEAVIERGLTADMAFGFIPLVFALVGAGGLVGFLVQRERARARATGGIPRGISRSFRATGSVPERAGAAQADVGRGPVVLESRGSRTGKFAGLLIFALIWNGIVSVFVVSLVHEWSRGGSISWFMALFLIPFVGVGLLVLGLAGHAGLALFNPRPRLFVSSIAVGPGGAVELRWEMLGSSRRVQRFRIQLEGREEATYRRGTDTRTDKSVFARIELADVRDPAGIVAGEARGRLPAEAMHSFTAKNNKVVWALRVRGEISRWPDVDDEFPFTVLPQTSAGTALA